MPKQQHWIKVICPTCLGKGTKGYDKNGPKQCPLCKGDKKVRVPKED